MFLNQKSEITVSDLKKLDKHIIDNFVLEEAEDREFEENKDIYWAEGYLCAMISSPEPMIKMDQWMPYISGSDCVFDSEEHANQIMSILFTFNNNIAGGLKDDNFQPLYEKYNLKNEPKKELIIRWCTGYLLGIKLFTGDFLENERMFAAIFPILVGAELSSDIDVKEGDATKEEIVEKIPVAIKIFNSASSKVRKELISNIAADNQRNETVVNDNKVGRNDPCPCGSGKKFKKCCIVSNDNITIH